MFKRVVAAILWFVSVWIAVGTVGDIVGWPTDIGAVLGALMAAFVWMDPTGLWWGQKTPASSAARPADGLGAAAPSAATSSDGFGSTVSTH